MTQYVGAERLIILSFFDAKVLNSAPKKGETAYGAELPSKT
ncbi:hypothetical protein [Pseudomonas protegens]|nr:hypothetical protein [Pseudomonas protegens]